MATTLELYCGDTLVARREDVDAAVAPGSDWTTYEFTLTATEKALITDINALSWVAIAQHGEQVAASWVEVQTGSGGGTVTLLIGPFPMFRPDLPNG